MATMNELHERGRYANSGHGPRLSVLEIGLEDQVAVIEPDLAFWAVVERRALGDALAGSLIDDLRSRAASFGEEMNRLRFGLKPSAAYFNPTERCNFNCSYCYLPEDMRRSGKTMSEQELCEALERLLAYFRTVLPEGQRPQVIFHGSEPMVARESMFAGIRRFVDQFHFGVQTNASLLDDDAIAFLKDHGVAIGISLDAPEAELADATRRNWNGNGAFEQVSRVIDALADYPAFNVITTVTSFNVESLPRMVDFYHDHGVRVAMFNPVRITQPGGRQLKPANEVMSRWFLKALDRSFERYVETGQKLVIANFANVLAAVIAPTGRRLMCDISPCGGGRCFFAVSAHGDIFPCSEFIGFPEFRGGNLYRDALADILHSDPFTAVTTRRVEDFTPCDRCAIRHFCGAPCPAEVKAATGTLAAPSPYCEFYEEQVRYAFRVLARGHEGAFLWDGWEEETEETFNKSA